MYNWIGNFSGQTLIPDYNYPGGFSCFTYWNETSIWFCNQRQRKSMLHLCSAGSVQGAVHCWGGDGISQTTTGCSCISTGTAHDSPPSIPTQTHGWGSLSSTARCQLQHLWGRCKFLSLCWRDFRSKLQAFQRYLVGVFSEKERSFFFMDVFETKILVVITTRGAMGEAGGWCSAEWWGLSGFKTTNKFYEYSWFLYLCTASLANKPV